MDKEMQTAFAKVAAAGESEEHPAMNGTNPGTQEQQRLGPYSRSMSSGGSGRCTFRRGAVPWRCLLT